MTDQATLLAKLSEYDFIVVADTSGSMGEPFKGTTRWESMKESLRTFVRDVGAIDSDGIGFVQLGGQCIAKDGVTADNVNALLDQFSPRGGTPLAEALTAALKLAGKSSKKDFIVVYTDGVPDDKNAAKQVILNQANSQATDEDCTILFVQVGDDASATAYLKSLDDDLKGAKYDIVDAKTVAEADAFPSTAELIYAAIND